MKERASKFACSSVVFVVGSTTANSVTVEGLMLVQVVGILFLFFILCVIDWKFE